MDIRILRLSDLDACLRLSEQAGWNQISADWQRLITLWPASCFAGEEDGRVMATGTLATYGRSIGWVGMILVDEAVRRRGFGTRLFQTALDCGQQLGVETLGLDATDYGRPLYEKSGFEVHSSIRRWIRNGHRDGVDATGCKVGAQTDLLEEADWPSLLSLDRRVNAVDRTSLLRHLAGEYGARGRLCRGQGDVSAYALYRLGRFASMIGPIVARSSESALFLLDDLLADHDAQLLDTPVILDVPDDPTFARELTARRFTVQRELFRMVRPAATRPVLNAAGVFGGTGFELG